MHIPVLLALLPAVLAAPLIKAKRGDAISNKYIIKLKGDIALTSGVDIKATIAAIPDFEYMLTGFRGFAASLSTEELEKLQASDQVGR